MEGRAFFPPPFNLHLQPTAGGVKKLAASVLDDGAIRWELLDSSSPAPKVIIINPPPAEVITAGQAARALA